MDMPMNHSPVDACPCVIPETCRGIHGLEMIIDRVRRWMGANQLKLED